MLRMVMLREAEAAVAKFLLFFFSSAKSIFKGQYKDDSINESKNMATYICTKFFRFLVMLKKASQHAPASVYQFVPLQDFSHPWTDEMLYKKYNLTEEEIAFIESMIRPME